MYSSLIDEILTGQCVVNVSTMFNKGVFSQLSRIFRSPPYWIIRSITGMKISMACGPSLWDICLRIRRVIRCTAVLPLVPCTTNHIQRWLLQHLHNFTFTLHAILTLTWICYSWHDVRTLGLHFKSLHNQYGKPATGMPITKRTSRESQAHHFGNVISDSAFWTRAHFFIQFFTVH